MPDRKPVDYGVFGSMLGAEPGPGLDGMLDEFVADHGVDCVDRDGRTLLMNAVTGGRPDLVAGLVARGADVDAKDGKGFRALHLAALEGDVACTELLADADLDPRDGWGNTPLRRAAITFDADASVIAALLARGADPAVGIDNGVAPADLLGG